MIIIYVLELFLPTVIAIGLHSYFCHNKISRNRKAFFGILYFIVLNYVTFKLVMSCNDGIFDFYSVSNSSNIKILLLDCNLSFDLPLIMCLFFEKDVTLNKLIGYLKRFASDMRKYFNYSIRSAKADLKSEVANAYLDWLWWIIEPFCMMLIYTLIFGFVFQVSEDYFPIFIFSGLAMWNFFQRGISVSVNVVRNNKSIVTKIYLPKFILLLSRNFVNGFKMLVSFGIVIVMMMVFKVNLSWNIFYVIPIMIVFFLLTFGMGTILMHFGVYVNDLSYITGIVLSMLMYFTGIFYSVGKRIPVPFGEILEELNPVAFCIASMRSSLIYCHPASIKMLILWGNIGFAMIAIGVYTIYRNENMYVKVI